MPREHIVERALKLAQSGRFTEVEQIRRALVRDQYDQVDEHLAGPTLRRQLRVLCSRQTSDAVSGPADGL